MPNPSSFQSVLSSVYNAYSKDQGKVLVITSTLGWILSSMAQVFMFVTEKKIEKKEKKFLIPQEISDGIVNVGLFYTICAVIKKTGDWGVEHGKLAIKHTEDLIGMFKNDKQSREEWTQDLLRKFDSTNGDKSLLSLKKRPTTLFLNKLIDEASSLDYKKDIADQLKDKKILNDTFLSKLNTPQLRDEFVTMVKNTRGRFFSFKNGLGVITAIGSSVLASNIVTPVCRNSIGNIFQKNYIKNYTPKTTPVHNIPMSRTYSSFKI